MRGTAARSVSELGIFWELLPAEDRVLRGLRDAELHHALGRNLNRRAGSRVAAEPGFAIHEHDLAEAGNRKGILCFLVRQLDQLIDEQTRRLLRHAGLVRELS